MTVDEELQIVEEAKNDINAFKELYEYYFSRIFAYLVNRLPSQELCEDIASEVFVDAVEAIGKFDTSRGVRFGSWLYRVAHNKVVDYYKAHKLVNLSDMQADLAISESNTERKAFQSESTQQVAFVLSKLKSNYQQVLSLKYYSEMSNKEIAEAMGMKPRQLAVVLHRAHNAFEREFKKYFPETEIK